MKNSINLISESGILFVKAENKEMFDLVLDNLPVIKEHESAVNIYLDSATVDKIGAALNLPVKYFK